MAQSVFCSELGRTTVYTRQHEHHLSKQSLRCGGGLPPTLAACRPRVTFASPYASYEVKASSCCLPREGRVTCPNRVMQSRWRRAQLGHHSLPAGCRTTGTG